MSFENWTIEELFARCTDYDDGSLSMDKEEFSALRRMLQGKADGNSPVIPDGWVTVPVEPTPEMREAFHITNEEAEDGLHGVWSPDHQWQAMLSVAPQQGEPNRIQGERFKIQEEMTMGARLTKHRFKVK